MKKKMLLTMMSFMLSAAMLTACGSSAQETKNVRVITEEEMTLSGGLL